MMTELSAMLLEKGLVKGHVVLASGYHSSEKFEFDNIQGSLFKQTARELGRLIFENFIDCDTIVTVAKGANRLCEPVAAAVSEKSPQTITATQTTKNEGVIGLSHSEHMLDRKVVIVDDVFTRGTNTGQVAELLYQAGAMVLGVAVVLNRNQNSKPELETSDKKLPVLSLVHHPIRDWPSETCPYH